MLRHFHSADAAPATGSAHRKSADYCRRRARDCQDEAARADDPRLRQMLEQMAADWLRLMRAAEANAAPFLTEIGHKFG